MDLWSKGLGKRVLNLRLRERKALVERDGKLEIDGVMGAPVFWDYRVSLGERDVLDFLDFLKGPVPVQYLVGAEKRWMILATALAAPNPLSIPTTVIPLAQEACIANRAVTPSRPEP